LKEVLESNFEVDHKNKTKKFAFFCFFGTIEHEARNLSKVEVLFSFFLITEVADIF
jgi:hypothetical protein